MKFWFVGLWCLQLGLPSSVLAQAGALDVSFAPQLDNWVSEIVLQNDGKILVAGYFTQVNGQTHERMVRLNRDGAVDPTFVFSADDAVWSIVPDQNGGIFIRGYFTTVNGVLRNGIARIFYDGSLDEGFVTDWYDYVCPMVLQPDGKLVFGAKSEVIRLNPDGTRDTNFFPTAAEPSDAVTTVALGKDGRIFIGGWFDTVNGIPNQHRSGTPVDQWYDR